MRKIISGRRSSGRGTFEMLIDTSISTQYGSGTPSGSNQFFFPIYNGTDRQSYTVDFTIDWGDNSVPTQVNSSNFATACLHTYSNPGQYTIKAEGSIAGFSFWACNGLTGKSDGNKLIEIKRWGDLKLTGGADINSPAFTRVGQIFRSCANLDKVSASDTPWFPLYSPNDPFFPNNLNDYGARGLFSGCGNLDIINNIAFWDVSRVKEFSIMFSGCAKWAYGTNANGPINLSNWDVSRGVRFERMFQSASQQDAKMFSNLGTLPGGYGGVGMDLGQMFAGCTNFSNAGASGTMGVWNTGSVAIMDLMFEGCSNFNENIRNWNTGLCINMEGMFNGATIFNQNIGSWNVSSVTNMKRMFHNASAFDQDLGNWNVNSWNATSTGNTPITGPSSTFTLSTANYDSLLIGWDAYSYPSWPGGTVDFGNSQYSLGTPAAIARASLIQKWGTINDGGGV